MNRTLQAQLGAMENREKEREAIERTRLQLEADRIEKDKLEQQRVQTLRRLMADAIAQLNELRETLP